MTLSDACKAIIREMEYLFWRIKLWFLRFTCKHKNSYIGHYMKSSDGIFGATVCCQRCYKILDFLREVDYIEDNKLYNNMVDKSLTFSDILKKRFGEELYTLLYDIIAEWYKSKGTYADLVKDIISLLTKEDEK